MSSHRNNSNFVNKDQQELLNRVKGLEEQLAKERRNRSEERYRLNQDIDYFTNQSQEYKEKFQKEYDAHGRTLDNFRNFEDRSRDEKNRLKDDIRHLEGQRAEMRDTVDRRDWEIRDLRNTCKNQDYEIKDLMKHVEELKMTVKERDERQDILEEKLTELAIENEAHVDRKEKMSPTYKPTPNWANPLPYRPEPKRTAKKEESSSDDESYDSDPWGHRN